MQYNAQVKEVIDGDTVWADIDLGFGIYTTRKLRMKGINAPELHGESAEAGQKSKEYLTERIGNKTVQITTYTPDKYGRMLADIFLDGVNINQEMIDKGFAVPYEKEEGR